MSAPVAGKLCCEVCGHVFDENEAGPPIYECGTCGQPQVGEDEDARRCQLCHKFCAKVADLSCPECEAPKEMIQQATEDDMARFDREQEEMERRRSEPPKPDLVLERLMAERSVEKAKDQRWWEGTGRAAFKGIGESKGFGDLGERIEHFVIDGGSDVIQVDKAELYEIAVRILRTER